VIYKEAHKGYIKADKKPYKSSVGRITLEMLFVNKQLVCTEAKEKNRSKDEHKGNQIESKID